MEAKNQAVDLFFSDQMAGNPGGGQALDIWISVGFV
jgi:hypothetical protein